MRAPTRRAFTTISVGSAKARSSRRRVFEEVEANSAKRPIVAQAQAEEDEETGRQPVVPQTLVQRHPARRFPVDGPTTRADHQIGMAGEDGADKILHLRRVVGPVRLHEHNGAGGAGGGGASTRETWVSIASPCLAKEDRAGGGDERGATVGRAVVHEQRATQQTQSAKLGQQLRQGCSLIENGYDDEVVWTLC